MRFGLHRSAVVAVLTCLSSGVNGQSTLILGAGKQSQSGPYTAGFKIHSMHKLGDGTTITHDSTYIKTIDSEGRRFIGITDAATGESPEHSIFEIYDPAARTTTRWNVPGKLVSIEKLPPPYEPGQPRRCWARDEIEAREPSRANEYPGSEISSTKLDELDNRGLTTWKKASGEHAEKENLGTRSFFGVEAVGERTTLTIPAGAIGNDAPIVRMFEVLRSKSPEMVVRMVMDDPRTGKRTRELVEFTPGEPDPSIFLPPEGYETKTVGWHETSCMQPH